ncbi:MAG: amino acid permease [Paenibacillus sp.]|nr:amino acid permease [Paenibacillus sp.]
MGAVLGSGILILPGYTAQLAGPASIISWVAMSLISIPLAYTFARLALKYRDFGGIARIVEQAFGGAWGALVGWFFFVWVATGQAVVGLTGAAYMVSAFRLPAVWAYLFAFGFLAAALLTNLLGMRASARLSLLLSGAVLILLLTTIALSIPDVERTQFNEFMPHGITGIGQACVLIFWAFFGWESITHLVPEFANPERDVMRSTWSSVFIIGATYTLLSIVTVGTGLYGEHATAAPLAELMGRAIGFSASIATAIVACIVCLGTLNVYLASSSRLGYALAKEGQFPAWFGGLDARGVPYRSALFLFVTNTLTLGAAYIGTIGTDRLILVPTTLGIIVYVIASLACVKLLWHDPVGRWSSLLSACFCLAVAPFSMSYLAVPVIVAIACFLYLRIKAQQRRRSEVNNS